MDEGKVIVGAKAEYREEDYFFRRRASPGAWDREEPWWKGVLVLALVLFLGLAAWVVLASVGEALVEAGFVVGDSGTDG